MIVINKLTDQTGRGKIPEMTGNRHNLFSPNVKTINAAVKTREANNFVCLA
jgi:hypothetical protein